MNTYVVWIEMDVAKIFKVSSIEKSKQILRRQEIKHHTSADPENHKNCEKFFHSIAEAISDASEILLVGPGLATVHFKSHLERHHHTGLAKKIVSMKTIDLVSEEKILAYSRDFFKQYDAFELTTNV